MHQELNICCSLFIVVACANTQEHQHIICRVKDATDGSPMLDNEHVKKYCIGDTRVFNACPYYPRFG